MHYAPTGRPWPELTQQKEKADCKKAKFDSMQLDIRKLISDSIVDHWNQISQEAPGFHIFKHKLDIWKEQYRH